MKKLFISLLAIAATVNVMAITYRGYAEITLESTDSYESCKAIIAESDELNDGLNPGYYAEINMDGREVALYVPYLGVNYQHLAMYDMSGLFFGIKADGSTNYRLKFSNVEGSLTIFDMTAGQVINVNSTTPNYVFTASATEDLSQRFRIGAVPTAYQICYQNGVFKIDNPETAALAVNVYPVDALTGQPKLDVAAVFTSSAAAAAHTDITPVGLAADTKYAVVVGEGATAKPTLIFRVR